MERSYLQEKELAIAEAHGLSRKQIRIMSGKHLDYVQMGILRTAMEQGIPEERVRKAAKAVYTPEEMRAVLNGSDPEEKKRILPEKAGWLIPLLSVPLMAGCMFAAGRSLRADQVILKSDHITLHTGDVFRPAQYILSYPEKADVILPEGFSADTAGGRIAVYRTSDGDQKVLAVRIEDHHEPEIRINEAEADPDDCMHALISAYDAEDGDLSRYAECTVRGNEIVYSVSDHAGNTASVSAAAVSEEDES